jgi:hypothetical protein
MSFQNTPSFPNGESSNNRNLNAKSVLDFLRSPNFFPPLTIALNRFETRLENGMIADALVEVTGNDVAEQFAIEAKNSSQPAVIQNAMLQAEQYRIKLGVRPMILVPYLSEESLKLLEQREISGIDMCGNCLIICRNYFVRRTGAPNQYKESRPLQNPYRGDSSIFTRCFLLRGNYATLTELHSFAHQRLDSLNPVGLRMSTASKVVQGLTDDLLVTKHKLGLFTASINDLFTKFEQRYRRLETRSLIGKTSLTQKETWHRLERLRTEEVSRSIATGIASAGYYGVLTGIERQSLYVNNMRAVAEALEIHEGRAFANIELIENQKELVYFDARLDDGIRWASPIQAWIELVQGNAREREAAQSLKDQLANRLVMDA